MIGRERTAASPRRTGRRPGAHAWAAPALAFIAAALVLFAPSVVGGKVLTGSDILLFAAPFPPQPPGTAPENPLQFDAAYVFESDQLQVRDALRAGRLPIWTSRLSAGRPLLAAQQSAPLFPPNWISSVLPYWESLVWVAVVKLVLAAMGTFLFCRSLGLSRGASSLGGMAFGFGTCLVVWLTHPHVNAYVLLPWLLLFAERLARAGRPIDLVGLAGALGLAQLGGQPESGLIVTLPVPAWIAYRLASARLARAEVARRAGLAAAAGAIGLLLGAVMIVPFLEALQESYRSGRGEGPPLEARAALTLLFPEYWGRPDRAAAELGPSNFVERTMYVGVLPAALAFGGLIARRPAGPQVFFAGLALSSVLIGLDSGWLTATVRDLPVLSQAELNRVIVLATFAVAVLGAYGLHVLSHGSAAERRRVAGGGIAAVLVPALVVLAAHGGWLSILGDGMRRAAGLDTPLSGDVLALGAVLRWLAFGSIAAALVAALALVPRLGRWLVPAAVALAALDLLVTGWGFNPSIDRERAAPDPPPAVRVLQSLTASGGRIAGDGGLGPNTATRYGLADARGHELPVVERHHRLWAALGGAPRTVSIQRTRLVSEDPTPRLLLDLFSVRAVLLDKPAFPELPVVHRGPGALVARNPSALPRAFVAYGTRPAGSMEQAVGLTAASTRREARDEPVIEDAGTRAVRAPEPATAARIRRNDETRVEVEAVARRPGRLVLLDTFYPGWRATVDGKEAAIRPANAAFRSVELPAGRHVVRFEYRPGSVYAGGAASLAALATLAVIAVATRRRRARRRTASVGYS